MSSRADKIAGWLRERADSAGARGFVFGLSGGIDSAVVSRLCQMAAPQRVLGVLLPCYSHPQDEEDARLVASAFTMPVVRVDLGSTFDALHESLQAAVKGLPTHVNVADIKQQMPEANVKPRLRMASLYFIANSLNYLVAGTGNRSEITLGYYTKFGDGGVDVLPIGGLLKSEVRSDRRIRDGIHLRGAREVPGRRCVGGRAGRGRAHRTAAHRLRPQAGAAPRRARVTPKRDLRGVYWIGDTEALRVNGSVGGVAPMFCHTVPPMFTANARVPDVP